MSRDRAKACTSCTRNCRRDTLCEAYDGEITKHRVRRWGARRPVRCQQGRPVPGLRMYTKYQENVPNFYRAALLQRRRVKDIRRFQ